MKLCKQCGQPIPYLGRRDLIDELFRALEPLVESSRITAAARGAEMHDDANDVRRDACILTEVILAQSLARVLGHCIACTPLDVRTELVRARLDAWRSQSRQQTQLELLSPQRETTSEPPARTTSEPPARTTSEPPAARTTTEPPASRAPVARCPGCNRFMSVFAGAIYFCSRCEGIELPQRFF